ncbi:MAG: polyprenyl synthetase family protein [Bacteroidales bacterium]|nr:polyprenyl synthetase family protein [Bacteroidales bacterium]
MLKEPEINGLVGRMFDEIQFTREPAGLYDPLRYMIEIGGKRVRPRLCLTTYSFFSENFNEGILAPASALEVFHSFTLMHDDIMDRSPLRRGMPTVWKKWNEDTAILSGDVMLIDAYRRIALAPAAVLDRVLALFTRTAAQVCDGQQYDMEFESVEEVPMSEYEKMIGLKTAVLLACSAEMGALIGGASDKECEALYRYGYELGMAFQVADDYLDAFGDEKVFGKPIGGDIVNGKKSWLTVRTMEKAPDRAAFLKAFALPADSPEQKAAKIAAVKDIYLQLGVDRDAKEEIVRFTGRAMDAVADAGLSPIRTEALRRFAEKLVGRAK